MAQIGQTHFKSLAAHAARFLKCVWPCWDMHQKVKVFQFFDPISTAFKIS